MSTTPEPSWRGLVGAILYGIDLAEPLDEQAAERAGALIGQRMFTEPVEDYYRAAAAALESGEAGDARPFLERLVAELDARRPWPEPAFRQVPAAEVPELRTAPVLATLGVSRMQLEERLSRLFDKSVASEWHGPVLVLRLRTGDTVALVATGGYTEPGVALRANTNDPTSVLESFGTLTGVRG